MSEPVLTEDEKSALLEGVSSGAVEVHSRAGTQYASVRRYDVHRRAPIVTNSYPRLQALNHKLAEKLAGEVAATLQCELTVKPVGVEAQSFSDCRLRMTAPAIHFPFTALPLGGKGLVVVEAELVRHLVEAFFGSTDGAGYAGGNSFTPGERSVAARFCDAVLASLREAWQPIVELSPQRAGADVSLELVDVARDSDPVLTIGFELAFGGAHGAFHVLWPRESLALLLPAFAGRQRERDSTADRQWEQALRRRLADVPIRITTCVGEVRHPVGVLAAVSEGGVLAITNPRAATVFAGRVPIIRGRFGVIEGVNAVETAAWLGQEPLSLNRSEENRHGE